MQKADARKKTPAARRPKQVAPPTITLAPPIITPVAVQSTPAPAALAQSASGGLAVASATAVSDGLRVAAYRGDDSILLAFNFDQEPRPGFAGFAVQCTAPGGLTFYLKNRLSFDAKITAETTPEARHAMLTNTNVAPYQKFRWVDFSSSRGPGMYTFAVSAMYHSSNGTLEPRATAEVTLELGPFQSGNLQIGFTRGMLSSQAYVDKFKNDPIGPSAKSITYDTKPFEQQYEWLGFHARRLMFDFLTACLTDKESTLDLFAYDLDEPDIIHLLTAFGPRLRAFLDDAPLHQARRIGS